MKNSIYLIASIAIIALSSFGMNDDIYRNYIGKYVKSENGKIFPADFEISFVKGKIYFTKGDKIKKYYTVDKGTIINNKGVKFHKFYLINKDIYVLLSYDKNEVMENTEYHTLIINGKTHLVN